MSRTGQDEAFQDSRVKAFQILEDNDDGSPIGYLSKDKDSRVVNKQSFLKVK